MTASGLGALPLAPGSLDDALNGIGYAVLDSAALPSFCALVRGEIDGLHTRGLLQASANKLATSRSEGVVAPDAGHVLAKRGVWELDVVLRGDVVAPDALEACPTLAHWYATECTAMLHTLQAAFPAAHLTGLDTLKVQYNAGEGGCFPMHLDTTPVISRRALTAILYLQEAWEERHGGQLQLLPFPFEAVDVAPLQGRVALFCSHTMPHRVLPARAPRHVLSLWFAGDATPFPARLPQASLAGCALQPAVLAALRVPANARLLAKVLFTELWADSITDAFGHTAAVHEALALHYREAEELEEAVQPALLQLLRRALPLRMAASDREGAMFDCSAVAALSGDAEAPTTAT